MQLVLFVALIFGLFVLSNKWPLITFWITLNLYFDPAGFLKEHIGVSVIGPIKMTDFLFLMLLWTFYRLFEGKISLSSYDMLYKRFLTYLIFLVFYYFIVNLWLVPLSLGRGDLWLDNFIDGRRVIYVIAMGYMVYKVFSRFGGKLLFIIVLYTAAISFALFFISYLLKIELVPIFTFDRYGDGSLMRTGMASYGLFYWLIFWGWIFVFLKSGANNSDRTVFKWTLFLFTIFVIVLLMTYTRRTYLELAITPVLIYVIVNKCTNINVGIMKIGGVFIVLTGVLAILTPDLLQGSKRIMKDSFLLAFTGKDSQGERNYRVEGTGDLLLTKEYIKQNPIFGNGYYYFNYDDKDKGVLGDRMTRFAIASDAAREVPIYNVFFERGIVGFLIYIPFYIFTISVGWRLYNLMRRYFKILMALDWYSVVFSIMILTILLQMFTVKIYTLFGTYLEPIYMIYMSILFACYLRAKVIICNYEEKVNHIN